MQRGVARLAAPVGRAGGRMGKIALILVAIIAALIWFRLKAGGGAAKPAKRGPPAQPVQMVACAQCGVHLPTTEALIDATGRRFCTASHRDAAADAR